VDGADPATDWKGLHALNEAPRLLSPANGWITNTNNWPYSAAGRLQPQTGRAIPKLHGQRFGENPARPSTPSRVLKDRKDFTLPGLIWARL
jgi:acyl-homoserine-lactone acylase